MILSYVGALLVALGAVSIYIGLRQRGSLPGASKGQRLRRSVAIPSLMIGIAGVLIGGFLLAEATH
jgi:hypothetical protein